MQTAILAALAVLINFVVTTAISAFIPNTTTRTTATTTTTTSTTTTTAPAPAIVPSNRQLDPIVLKGSDLAELLGTPIGQILGFNFDPNARNSNQWTQVPIQIDEMHYQSWETIKNEPDCRLVGRTLPDTLVYADSETYSGPDEDPNFDQDDELVFMARHLGSYRARRNQFIFNDNFAEVSVTDPTQGNAAIGYLYLFDA